MDLRGISKQSILLFDWDAFSLNLAKLIKFHSLNSVVPINADRWEEIVNAILTFMGKNPSWNQGSHSAGADIWTKEFIISAKSGKVINDKVNISSYRLTRFKDLEEMKGFIDGGGKNFDIYLCCARTDSKTKRIYKIFLIGADTISAKRIGWSNSYNKKDKHSGWQGIDNLGISLKIVKNMSNQLWMEVPLNLCNEILTVKIDKRDLGIKVEEPLKD